MCDTYLYKRDRGTTGAFPGPLDFIELDVGRLWTDFSENLVHGLFFIPTNYFGPKNDLAKFKVGQNPSFCLCQALFL